MAYLTHDLLDYSLSGSSVHAICQARILEWVVIFFSRGSSQPRDQTYIAGSPTLQANSLQTEPPGKPEKESTLNKENVLVRDGGNRTPLRRVSNLVFVKVYKILGLTIHTTFVMLTILIHHLMTSEL